MEIFKYSLFCVTFGISVSVPVCMWLYLVIFGCQYQCKDSLEHGLLTGLAVKAVRLVMSFC